MSLVTLCDRGPVRVATMTRPRVRNAMDTALLGELLDAVGDAAADEGVRVLVLSGAEGTFSAGADLHEPLDDAARLRRIELFCAVYEALGTSPMPTVAAVAGACIGGGVEVAAACDLRVADPSATFRFPGAALGMPVGAAKLVGLVGLGTAKDLALTSRTFERDEAVRIGFVQRAVGGGEHVEAAVALGQTIADNHPGAVAALKRQFDRFSGLGDRIAVENDWLRAVTEAQGDYAALGADDAGVGSWAGGGWLSR